MNSYDKHFEILEEKENKKKLAKERLKEFEEYLKETRADENI